MEKFSFLMCVNRKGPFLAAAIESVLEQTCTDFSFFIVANNCDDELWDFLASYEDSRLSLHRTSIGQLAFNLNFGVNLIKDGYILRIDADDVCLPDRLAITKKYLRELNYPDVLGGAAILINEQDEEIGVSQFPCDNRGIRSGLWRRNPMIHPACAISAKSIIALRGYLGGFMSEDYDLWLRASTDRGFIFRNIDQPLIRYRIGGDQARGNPLGYAEVAGFMLREFLLRGEGKFFLATLLAIFKRYFRAK
ncbi:glycosyltransferase [Variovorax boronicumulans]|uniref:glycosyltransferase n=1 Tax=Variovorax boronicumulans TaxID=436515 RepID=UPI0012E49204|nr:glycosyltransferase [Variovorax boronicumulans]GER12849.1 hypothetical protein VHAB30_40320 [Variovorax boronicumulans]